MWRQTADMEVRHKVDVEVTRARQELETALRTEQDKLAEAMRLVYGLPWTCVYVVSHCTLRS